MIEVGGKPGGALHRRQDRRRRAGIQLDLGAARAAVQVPVLVARREVIGLAPVRAVMVPCETEFLEEVEGAIHRRRGGRRVVGPNPLDELRAGRMAVRRDDDRGES